MIIPTYNRKAVVAESIDSVTAQTHHHWEIIVVDDGSTDGTVDMLRATYRDHPNITVVPISNSGAATARNVGVQHSRHQWLTFLDSDDTVDPNWLAALVAGIDGPTVGIVSCGVEMVDAHRGLVQKFPKLQSKAYFDYRVLFIGGCFMLRKDVLQAAGGYDDALRAGQHNELAIRYCAAMKRKNLGAVPVRKKLVNIIDRGGKSIRKNHLSVYMGMRRCAEKHGAYLREVGDLKLLHHYLTAAGARALRVNKPVVASRMFWEAWKLKPFNPMGSARLLRSVLLSVLHKLTDRPA